MTGTESDFGREFDSLADVITFGAAPALVAHLWGLSVWSRLGWLVPLYFVVCCATRLARFNVQTVRADKRFFVGLPCPAAAGGIACILLVVPQVEGRRWLLVGMAVALGLLGSLMVSTFRYWSFKSLDFRRPHSYRVALPLAAMILLLAFYPEAFLPVMALAYALSGPTLWLLEPHRHRSADPATAAAGLGEPRLSRIALVHSVSLTGKEVAERLAQRPGLCTDLRLFALDESMVGTLTEGLDGAAFVARVEEGCFEGVDLAIFCGEIELDRRAMALLPPGGRAIVASHGATTADGVPAVAGIEEFSWLGQDRLLAPAAAAVGLTQLLAPLRAFGLRRAVATAVLPASELGTAGIDALFEESRALLAMAKPAKPVHFPAQIAFNLLPSQPFRARRSPARPRSPSASRAGSRCRPRRPASSTP